MFSSPASAPEEGGKFQHKPVTLGIVHSLEESGGQHVHYLPRRTAVHELAKINDTHFNGGADLAREFNRKKLEVCPLAVTVRRA